MNIAKLSEFYINGRWVTPHGQAKMDVINPATEGVLGALTLGDEHDANNAVAAAKAAAVEFAQTSKQDRLDLLHRILTIYTRRVDEFADAMRLEMGAPRDFARDAQAQVGIDHLTALIDDLEALDLHEVLRNGDEVFFEPIGVCGLITPWNWPLNQIILKVGPAMAAGCTMVLKPSELTPLSAILLAEVLDEAGVPAGVFNLIHGEGPVVGAALSRHEDVAMMSFTGSTRAGVAIMRDGAETVTKVTLELGGKSPNILFADCDLEKAVREGIDACFVNTGQSCDAATRMLVERSVYDDAVALAADIGSQIAVGNPEEAGSHLGPLISQAQYDRVQAMIKVGIDEGARLLCGGLGKPGGFELGYYAKPTIFADVNNDMRIAREEVFGPVMVVIPFEDEAEAIRIANDTEYGLGAYVQSGDLARARRVAARLDSGTVNINGGYMAAGSPFGGYKRSGIGREGGQEGIRDFQQIKLIAMP